ncbi:hypothetical protein DFH06DRAFT_1445948 [Mycena polygramma]|nr:hypothetical protein DFH06DRAFT_1445948 [Mycena polygramma]
MLVLGQAILGLPSLVALALFSLPQASALVVPRGDINATLVPSQCLTTCQPALTVQTTCGTDLKCRCTNANGNSLEQCIDCVADTKPDMLTISVGETVLRDYAALCAQNNFPISSLTLSLSTSSASPTGGGTNAANTNDASTPISSPRLTVAAIACVLAALLGAVL